MWSPDAEGHRNDLEAIGRHLFFRYQRVATRANLGGKNQSFRRTSPSRRDCLAPARHSGTRRGAPLEKDGAGVDGVLIPLRQEGYTEVKVGCVFDIVERPAKEPETEKVVERAHAVNLTYGRVRWT